jgi:hypothetical protein
MSQVAVRRLSHRTGLTQLGVATYSMQQRKVVEVCSVLSLILRPRVAGASNLTDWVHHAVHQLPVAALY